VAQFGLKLSNGDPGVIVASLFDMDVLTVGGFGATDWTPGWYTFLSSGNYYLEIGVANIGDNTAPELTSVIGVDNVRLTPVPEPAPLVGGGLVGLLGLGLHWRRHRRHATA
jgi:hypothetical protein